MEQTVIWRRKSELINLKVRPTSRYPCQRKGERMRIYIRIFWKIQNQTHISSPFIQKQMGKEGHKGRRGRAARLINSNRLMNIKEIESLALWPRARSSLAFQEQASPCVLERFFCLFSVIMVPLWGANFVLGLIFAFI